MKQFKRSKRVGDQIRKQMSIVVDSLVSEEDLPMITVTDVSLSDDLKYAKVFISALGDESARTTALSFLEEKKKKLRAELSRRVHLKFIPEISFAYDESIEKGLRIESILSELEDLKKPEPGAPDAQSAE